MPFSLRSFLILSSHRRLGFPKCFFLIGLPVQIFKVLLSSPILVTWLSHLNILDLIILTKLGERYKLLSSSLWSLLHSPFLSLLRQNIRLRIHSINPFTSLWICFIFILHCSLPINLMLLIPFSLISVLNSHIQKFRGLPFLLFPDGHHSN